MKKNDLSPEAFRFEGKMSLKQALPLGMQHVLAMFVGNLTPLLIITGACGLAGGEFADLRVTLLQNAMLVAGIVTLVQLYSIGPIGGKVPIIMGTSSGFIGVFSSVAASMGGGAAVMMFSSIVVSGIQLITREPLTPRSLSIVSVALGLGYGIGANNGILAHAPQMLSLVFGGSGIVPAALVAILLNLAIPKDENG